MTWFKFDAGFFGNRKVIRAGRDGRDIYQWVLCCNRQRNAKGIIPAGDVEPWFAARHLGITAEDAARGVTAAVRAGLLAVEGEFVRIIGWDADWAGHRLSRAEIQANYRTRKAKTPDVSDVGVT